MNFSFCKKKPVKIACVVLGIFVALFLIVAALISPVAKYVIEKNSKQWVGRQIVMDDLSVNLFTGSVETEGFHFKEKDDVTDFVSLDTFRVAINPFKLLVGEIHIRYITLVEPTVRLVQYDSTFNFTDLTELGGDEEETDVDTDDEGWALGIYNIRLAHGSVLYKDMTVDSEWNLKNLNLVVPGVYFSGKSTDAGISFGFAEGGTLTTQAKYDMEKSTYDVKVQLKGLALDNFLPYVTSMLNVSTLGGVLDADVHLVGSADVPTDVEITGNVQVSGLDMKDMEEADVVSIEKITADIRRINPQNGVCTLDSIVIDGLNTHYDMYADRDNFTNLVKETAAEDSTLAVQVEEEDTVAPMVVLIKKIVLKNGSLFFTDNTLRDEPFRYELTRIGALLTNFNPSGDQNNCDMTLETPGGGNMRIRWNGSMEGLQNQKLTLFLKNVNMQAFSPYMMQYFAYPVSDGRLSVQSENIIKDYKLDGRNRLDMYNLRVGEKDKSVKPDFNIPLKTGLYILRDKDDKIEIDLPISGDVNAPDFSYKKVIIKTLCNLVVKLAVSPLRAVASGLGLSPDELSMMTVNASQPGLSSEDYAKLDKLVTVQKTKPEMQLIFVQQINWKQAVKNRSVFEMKRRYYISQHPELASQPRLTLVDFGKINDIKDDDSDFSDFVSKESGTSEGSVYERSLKLFPADSAEVRLTRQLERRNAEIADYLVKQGMDVQKVSVTNLPPDAMRRYEGKDMYKIDMSMGETLETAQSQD